MPVRAGWLRPSRLGAVLAAVALAGGVWWALAWASGMRPLAPGSVADGPLGMAPVHGVYRWTRGGRFEVVLWLHNSASVPGTVTGAEGTGPGWDGVVAGPFLRLPPAGGSSYPPPRPAAFRPVRIPADGMRPVVLVYTANPGACAGAGGGISRISSATLRFTTLGVFENAESVSFSGFRMRAPTPADCH